jgi:hypothetical protein
LYASDPNYYRALTALGSLHAKAARMELAKASEIDFSMARDHTRAALSALKASVEFWRSYRPADRQRSRQVVTDSSAR